MKPTPTVLSATAALVLLLAQPGSAQTEKVLAPVGSLDGRNGVVRLQEYEAFTLYRIEAAELDQSRATTPQLHRLVDADWLLLGASAFDTQRGVPHLPVAAPVAKKLGYNLHLVQFVGPIQGSWLKRLRVEGVVPIHAIPRFGYLVWTDGAGRQRLEELVQDGALLQYHGPWEPYFKLGPRLRERLYGNPAASGDEIVTVTVQRLRPDQETVPPAQVGSLVVQWQSAWVRVLGYDNAVARVRVDQLAEIAAQPTIVSVGERPSAQLFDEVQAQIVAGSLDASETAPAAPGYLALLTGLGFSTDPATYPIVDFSDDGIGNGTTASTDPTLHEGGNDSNPTRLVYVDNCTAEIDGSSMGGHGHLNVSIAGGYDTRTGFPYEDPDGYLRGLGVNPFGRFGGTRVFSPLALDLSGCDDTEIGLIRRIQDSGATISNQSWGCTACAATYDASSQAFDAGVRDADDTEPDRQEMTFVFPVGNGGPSLSTVATPANAKNVITVGASENYRPDDEDGSWTDGCQTPPDQADNITDLAPFSARGPAPGDRFKPDLVAPGTHIQGTASTALEATGQMVCDPEHPSAQTTFSASTGTSHAAPVVAGLASLIVHWLEQELGNIDLVFGFFSQVPSPAVIKAYLGAHTRQLGGAGTGGNLPTNSQGWGMPIVSELFDDTPKFVIDQDKVFISTGAADWTWSGAVADPNKPVRIVMAYTDAPGLVGVSPQVNDLDLLAEIDGATFLGNNFVGAVSTTGGDPDANNNVEAVFRPAGEIGDIVLTVRATQIAGDGVPLNGVPTDQDFSLVCYNCVAEPTFSLFVSPSTREVCAPDDAVFSVNVGSALGFSDPVDLVVTGAPVEITPAFDPTPVTPPDLSVLTLAGTDLATAGNYPLEITATSGATNLVADVELTIRDAVPDQVLLTTPADAAALQPTDLVLDWEAAVGTTTYRYEVATDPGMTTILTSDFGLTETSVALTDLPTNTTLYWQVTAENQCGSGLTSAIRSFTTAPLPGVCPGPYAPLVTYIEDFEAGEGDWSHEGLEDSWELSSGRANSGLQSFRATAVAIPSEQSLISPAILLPAIEESPIHMKFWNYQAIEDRPGGCFDGAVLDISTDDGMSWTPLDSELLTDPYDGAVSALYGNSLADQDAWCGDPQDWLESIIDLDAFAGQQVRFRFHLATDTSTPREGWYVDDIVVQSCNPTVVFRDGLETGDTSFWTETEPPPP